MVSLNVLQARFRELLSRPEFIPVYDQSLPEERQSALVRLKKVCDEGFISVLDFIHNPLWVSNIRFGFFHLPPITGEIEK